MPWIIGIDEAGYGPPLGPLVMTSVACRIPGSPGKTDLWQLLEAVVRGHSCEPDERILIADSKLVYSTARGLHDLEFGVAAALPRASNGAVRPLANFVDWLCPPARTDLTAECWYTGTTQLPLVCQWDQVARTSERFASCSKQKRVSWGPIRSFVVCPGRFNRLVERWGSKGAVLAEGLAHLVQFNLEEIDASAGLHFIVDKHGGRNNYAAMLQNTLPDGLVCARQESMACSTYQVLGLGRKIEFQIQPRADLEHFCVALASMVSKYLRELFMHEFNAFWRAHVPDLKPTAGYRGDAGRFFEAIRPTAERLAIAEPLLWRYK